MRKRLAALAAATTSLVLVAFLVPLAVLVRTVAADRAVNAATLQAQSLISVINTSDLETVRLTLDQVNATTSFPVTVFFPDKDPLGAPADRTPAVELAMTGRSLAAQARNGRQVLVSVQGRAGGPAVVATLVPAQELHRGVGRAWLVFGLLGLALVGVGVLVADRLARSMVGPIGELSAVSERLARGDLNARARPAGPPEVRRVATALNHLARRIRDLLRQEREAAADLSHRLRTPLTALRLDAEALTGSDGADRICADVDALERAVTRVIAEARHAVTDAEVQAAGGPAHCDAAAVVRERVDFWSALADDTERDVTTDLAPSPLPVGLSANDLSAAVDALLGNVFAHTCDGTRFAVTLTAVPGGGARLVIRDYGPGFPGPSPHQLLQRGASGAASTGLGLDISCRAARASGGDLTVESPPEDGAQVTCVLGPAKAGER